MRKTRYVAVLKTSGKCILEGRVDVGDVGDEEKGEEGEEEAKDWD